MKSRYEEIVEVEKSSYDYISGVEKFNPYHDKLGRFATAEAATFQTITTKDPAKQHWADKSKLREQQRQIKVQEGKVEEAKKELTDRLHNGTFEEARAARKKLLKEVARLDEMKKPIPGLDPKAKLSPEKTKPEKPKAKKVEGDPETTAGVKAGKPMTEEQADSGNGNPKWKEYEEKRQKASDLAEKCSDFYYEKKLYGFNYNPEDVKTYNEMLKEYRTAKSGMTKTFNQYGRNCQSCVVAYEARLRGYDVEAAPREPKKNLRQSELARITSLAWIDPATGKPPLYTSIQNSLYGGGKAVINDISSKINVGERYTFQNINKNGKNGHIVSLRKTQSGEIEFYDPQSNKHYKGQSAVEFVEGFSKVDSPKIMRIDNAILNPKYADAVLVPKGGKKAGGKKK